MFLENKLSFQETLLKNAREIELENEKVLVLSLEDSLINLCLDMSEQAYHNEVELKYLLDLLLLVEKNDDKINWKSFLNKSKICGIYRFVIAIFTVGNKLFNMPIPNLISKQEKLEERYIELFISEILKECSEKNLNNIDSANVVNNIMNNNSYYVKENENNKYQIDI